MQELVLENPHYRFGVCPELGGSITRFERCIDGTWHAVMRPTPGAPTGSSEQATPISFPEKSSGFGSFTLAPFSNRIPRGEFTFAGQHIKLDTNTPQGNAQHGDVRSRPWVVKKHTQSQLILTFNTADHTMNWPWAFTMEIRYTLEDTGLHMHMCFTNQYSANVVAGFGIHPYFVRNFNGADSVALEFKAEGHYTTDESLIPTTGMSPISPELDFSQAKAIEQHLDDVFGGYHGHVQLHWLKQGQPSWVLDMRSSAAFEHLVVFTSPDQTLALEPVTNATNGFNLMNQGHAHTGVAVLAPQQMLRGSISLSVEPA